ncbi:hypothetical protein F4782DRAFT_501377 [Xylaria castorea]|nr:hypothetical protein F4782DRAFT_501377 [Xylaria castorea]
MSRAPRRRRRRLLLLSFSTLRGDVLAVVTQKGAWRERKANQRMLNTRETWLPQCVNLRKREARRARRVHSKGRRICQQKLKCSACQAQ